MLPLKPVEGVVVPGWPKAWHQHRRLWVRPGRTDTAPSKVATRDLVPPQVGRETLVVLASLLERRTLNLTQSQTRARTRTLILTLALALALALTSPVRRGCTARAGGGDN